MYFYLARYSKHVLKLTGVAYNAPAVKQMGLLQGACLNSIYYLLRLVTIYVSFYANVMYICFKTVDPQILSRVVYINMMLEQRFQTLYLYDTRCLPSLVGPFIKLHATAYLTFL